MDIAVIGLGLIGGSVLRALAAAGHRVTGYDADPATRAVARTAAAQVPQRAGWHVAGTVADAVDGTALAVVAVPAPAVGAVFDRLAEARYAGLVTDVTSVKGPVLDLARTRLTAGGRSARFIGGHPMAGTETSGFQASEAALLRGCAWVLCLEPPAAAPPQGAGAVRLSDWLELAALLTTLGARVVPSTAAAHDRAVAVISHVPHLLASALAAVAGDDPLALTLAAGSFRDGTRVAASRPELIAAMCGGNTAAVRDALDTVLAGLGEARSALGGADPVAGLVPWLTPGYGVRRGWPAPAGATVELPAHVDDLLGVGETGGWVTAVAADRSAVTVARPDPGAPPAAR